MATQNWLPQRARSRGQASWWSVKRVQKLWSLKLWRNTSRAKLLKVEIAFSHKKGNNLIFEDFGGRCKSSEINWIAELNFPSLFWFMAFGIHQKNEAARLSVASEKAANDKLNVNGFYRIFILLEEACNPDNVSYGVHSWAPSKQGNDLAFLLPRESRKSKWNE